METQAPKRYDRARIKAQLEADRIELIGLSERTAATCGAADREALRVLAACDRAELWREEACRNTAEWAARHFHISAWKAAKMISSAHALEQLPYISASLEKGSLSLDKVIELTRFATPAAEVKLAAWARRTTPKGIRERADLEKRIPLKIVLDSHEARYFSSWWDEMNGSLRIEGMLPADEGARLTKALDRLATKMPDPPEGEPKVTREQKFADALAALASAQISSDTDPDRATMVLHADVEMLISGKGTAELAASLPIHPEMARRLCCGSRLQLVIDGKDGPLGAGDVIDGIPHGLRRQVLRRDGHRCTFTGCNAEGLLTPHHIELDCLQGPTDMFNLTSLCPRHHRYVHELGWGVTRTPKGELTFFTPGGRRYDPGPDPPTPAEVPRTRQMPEHRLIEARSYLGALARFI
ncbi:MAG: DUF222 domain-containing protein [Actinobacteria bacterium]|nr:DUF222 domain-containing protein [Actinomycetota bacterium]